MSIHTFYGKWRRYKVVSLVVITIGLVISSGVCIYALRQNNLTMTRLRQAVYVADEVNGDIQTALNNLRQFVYGHMNTNLKTGESTEPPIQLINSFNRAVEAEQAKVAALTGGANQVYVDAQKQCEVSSVPLTIRARCIQDYVSAHSTGLAVVELPPKEAFTFNFASPTWSPDLAGWSMVVVFVFVLLLIIRLITGFFIGRRLKR